MDVHILDATQRAKYKILLLTSKIQIDVPVHLSKQDFIINIKDTVHLPK